jgi:hypothetical protein
MNLTLWAKRWNIPTQALQELDTLLGVEQCFPNAVNSSEAAVLNVIKAEASRKGCRLWRNNVGGVHTAEGGFFRYGLANESKAMNEIIKSADLIGIRPLVITADLVDHTIGQFISREIKPSKWKFTGTPREIAQQRWATLITSMGGDACFATNEGTL